MNIDIQNSFNILNLVNEGMLVIDKNYKVIFWNRWLEQFSKILSDQIIGKDFFEQFSNLDKSVYRLRLSQVFELGSPALFSPQVHKYFIPCATQDGHLQTQECTALPIKDAENEVIYCLISVRDVTALFNRINDMKQLTLVKEKFLMVCSHDLRAPLNVILCFSELLCERSDVSHEVKQDIQHIYSAGKMLLELVNSLLDIGKSFAKNGEKVPSNLIPIFLSDIVFSSFELMKALAVRKGIDLTFHDASQFKAPVVGNPLELKRVVNNLLSNAIKFTPTGGFIKISLNNIENGFIELSVTDSGVGIPPEKIPILFDEYTDASTAGTSGEKSTGLGLSIIKQILAQNSGTIHVQSTPGSGSKFSIKMETRNISELEKHKFQETKISLDSSLLKKQNLLIDLESLGEKRILCIDDDPVSLKLMLAFLRSEKFIVETAASAYEAYEKLQQLPFDIIFVDMELPDISGDELAKKIREYEKANFRRKTRLIACTGHGYQEMIERMISAGCDEYVVKPYSKERIYKAMII